MADTCLNLALVGAGIFPNEAHFHPWIELVRAKRVRIACVWSRSEGSAKKLADKYTDELGITVDHVSGPDALEDLIKSPGIDAVCVALPICTQAEVTERFLRAKKHVLQEKPIAGDLGDARSLVKAADEAKASGVVCAIAENFRIEDTFMRSSTQFGKEGKLGELLEIQWTAFVHMPPENKYAATQWRKESEYNGGMIMDAGVHTAAALRVLAGGKQVERVSAYCSRKGSHLPKIDTVAAILSFEQECESPPVTATLHLSFAGKRNSMRVHLLGQNGDVVISRESRDGKHGYSVTTTQCGSEPEKQFYAFSGIEKEIEGFVEVCQIAKEDGELINRHWMSDGCSARAAYADMSLIEAILTSGERNGDSVVPQKPS